MVDRRANISVQIISQLFGIFLAVRIQESHPAYDQRKKLKTNW